MTMPAGSRLAHKVRQALSAQGTRWHAEAEARLACTLVPVQMRARSFHAAVKRRRLQRLRRTPA